jgi:predicted alpha/beta hydrolase
VSETASAAGSARETILAAGSDGHRAELIVHAPAAARRGLYFVPAMGVAARHYETFAGALAQRGVACAVHEWRGNGSSTQRAMRGRDWGYRELLDLDLPASFDALRSRLPAVRWSVGGHSLGAQFAALFAAVDEAAHGIAVIAAGAPYWRTFPGWRKHVLRGVFGFMNGLGAVNGYFPGRRTGFAGNEARGVIRDWTRTGREGHYRLPGLRHDYEHALAALRAPVIAIRMQEDWYVPHASLEHLLKKIPHAEITHWELGREAFGGHKADHFTWMKHPSVVAGHVAQWILAQEPA